MPQSFKGPQATTTAQLQQQVTKITNCKSIILKQKHATNGVMQYQSYGVSHAPTNEFVLKSSRRLHCEEKSLANLSSYAEEKHQNQHLELLDQDYAEAQSHIKSTTLLEVAEQKISVHQPNTY